VSDEEAPKTPYHSGSLELFFAPVPQANHPVVVFQHIPKTAGTSFRALARDNYRSLERRGDLTPPESIPTWTTERDRSEAVRRWYGNVWASIGEDDRARLVFAASHSANFLLRLLRDRKVVRLTLVREPVDRALSRYFFRNPVAETVTIGEFYRTALALSGSAAERGRVLAKELGEGWSEEQVIARGSFFSTLVPDLFNGQARSLLGPEYDLADLPCTLGPPVDASVWRKRLHGIAADYVLGLQDRFLEFAELASAPLGWTQVSSPSAKVNRERIPAAELSAETRELIRECNWLDHELYNYAVRRFAAEAKALPPRPARRVAPVVSKPSFAVLGAQHPALAEIRRALAATPGITLLRPKDASAKKASSNGDANGLVGVASSMYMRGDTRDRAQRLHELAPTAKLVCVLDDPIRRAYLEHRTLAERGAETRSFSEAIAQQLEPSALAAARTRPGRTDAYVAQGEYGRIVSDYLERFDREQLLAVFASEVDDDRDAVLAALSEHLGVEVRPAAANQARRGGIPAAALQELKGIFRENVWPQLDEELARTARRAIQAWVRRWSEDETEPEEASPQSWLVEPEIDEHTRAALEKHYSKDAMVLERVLDLPVPWAREEPTQGAA
jgi:hypothetical protein